MAKNYRMKAEPGHSQVTGHNVDLVHTVIKRAVVKNVPWIAVYVIVTAGGIVASYFTAEWASVGLSMAVAVITFFVGLRMVKEIITITKEIR
jgi:hypothetical protein